MTRTELKFRLRPGEGLAESTNYVESGGSFHDACYALGWRWGADGKSEEETAAVAKQFHETFPAKDTLDEAIRTCGDGRAQGAPYSNKASGKGEANDGAPFSPRWRAKADVFLGKEPPPVHWIVEGFLPAGCTILAAPAKSGKSLLAFQLAIAVGSGGKMLDTFAATPGHVLYLDLESNEGRAHRRVREVLGEHRPENLDIEFYGSFPAMGDGCVETLSSYLNDNPTTRLVVVDIRENISPDDTPGASAYKRDYRALAPLTALANERGIALVLIDHTVKEKRANGVLNVGGTMGRVGAVDAIMTLDVDTSPATLVMTSRDVDIPDLRLQRIWPTGWHIADDDAPSHPQQEMPKADKAMLAFLDAHGPAKLEAIHAALAQQGISLTVDACKQRLYTLRSKSLLESPERGYFGTPQSGGKAPTGESQVGEEAVVGHPSLTDASPPYTPPSSFSSVPSLSSFPKEGKEGKEGLEDADDTSSESAESIQTTLTAAKILGIPMPQSGTDDERAEVIRRVHPLWEQEDRRAVRKWVRVYDDERRAGKSHAEALICMGDEEAVPAFAGLDGLRPSDASARRASTREGLA